MAVAEASGKVIFWFLCLENCVWKIPWEVSVVGTAPKVKCKIGKRHKATRNAKSIIQRGKILCNFIDTSLLINYSLLESFALRLWTLASHLDSETFAKATTLNFWAINQRLLKHEKPIVYLSLWFRFSTKKTRRKKRFAKVEDLFLCNRRKKLEDFSFPRYGDFAQE